jgi:hypothetical protein
MRAISAFLAVGAAFAAACGGGSPTAPVASDGGGDAPASLACPPATLGSWQPAPYHHANAAQPNACTAALIADFYAACLGPMASAATCDPTWGSGQDAAHQACETCLLTPVSATSWGAVIQFGNKTVSLNVGGCIELLDSGAGGAGVACATSVQQADGCQHKACDATCPVTDDTSFANWKACVSASETSVCASYTSAAGCDRVELDAGPAARCINAQTFEEQFVAIGEVFCAP